MQITGLLDDEHAEVSSIVSTLETDPALAARVLRLANSAAFGGRAHIDTLGHAVMRLGAHRLKTLLFLSHVLVQFSTGDDERFDFARFWRHSLLTACMARAAARQRRHYDADALLALGLLHDIGKAIMCDHSPETFARVSQAYSTGEMPFYAAEVACLGVHHGHVGYWAFRRWGFPDSFGQTALRHHQPGKMPLAAIRDKHAIFTVHLANIAAHRFLDDGRCDEPDEQAALVTGMSVDDVAEVAEDALAEATAIAESMKLPMTTD